MRRYVRSRWTSWLVSPTPVNETVVLTYWLRVRWLAPLTVQQSLQFHIYARAGGSCGSEQSRYRTIAGNGDGAGSGADRRRQHKPTQCRRTDELSARERGGRMDRSARRPRQTALSPRRRPPRCRRSSCACSDQGRPRDPRTPRDGTARLRLPLVTQSLTCPDAEKNVRCGHLSASPHAAGTERWPPTAQAEIHNRPRSPQDRGDTWLYDER
jgi:hypothetical protein